VLHWAQFLLVYEYMAAGDLTKALARDQAEPRRFVAPLSVYS